MIGNPAEVKAVPLEESQKEMGKAGEPAAVVAAVANTIVNPAPVVAELTATTTTTTTAEITSTTATAATSTTSSSAAAAPATTLSGACVSSVLQPVSLPVMNSLVATNKVVVDPAALAEDVNEASMDNSSVCVDGNVANPILNTAAAAAVASVAPASVVVNPSQPLPDDILPGPTYAEPMETEQQQQQQQQQQPMEMEEGTLSKAESTTMLCEETKPKAINVT